MCISYVSNKLMSITEYDASSISHITLAYLGSLLSVRSAAAVHPLALPVRCRLFPIASGRRRPTTASSLPPAPPPAALSPSGPSTPPLPPSRRRPRPAGGPAPVSPPAGGRPPARFRGRPSPLPLLYPKYRLTPAHGYCRRESYSAASAPRGTTGWQESLVSKTGAAQGRG